MKSILAENGHLSNLHQLPGKESRGMGKFYFYKDVRICIGKTKPELHNQSINQVYGRSANCLLLQLDAWNIFATFLSSYIGTSISALQ